MKVDLEDLLNCEVDLVEDGMLRPWAVESVNRDWRLILHILIDCVLAHNTVQI